MRTFRLTPMWSGSTPYVGWVCCWFSPLHERFFSRYPGLPLGNGLYCTTGLTNLKVIQENEDGERAKYLFHEKLSSKCLYLFSYQKKGSKRPLIKAINSVSIAIVCYILSNWPFNRGDDNEKMGLRKSWPRPLSTVELCLKTTPRGRVYWVPLYKSVLH